MHDTHPDKPSIDRQTSGDSAGDTDTAAVDSAKAVPERRTDGGVTPERDVSLPNDDVTVTDQWVGTTIYLPESLRDELDLVFRKLNFERKAAADAELKKLKHYYPLVVQLGLERMETLDTEEVEPVLARLSSKYESSTHD